MRAWPISSDMENSQNKLKFLTLKTRIDDEMIVQKMGEKMSHIFRKKLLKNIRKLNSFIQK